MEEGKQTTQTTTERLSESIGFAETVAQRKLQLYKLSTAEKLAKSGSGLIVGIILVVLSSVTMLTLNIGLGFLLAEQTGFSVGISFLLLTVIYCLIMGLVVWLRHRLFTNPILARVVKKLF